jgi:hypothetical protein
MTSTILSHMHLAINTPRELSSPSPHTQLPRSADYTSSVGVAELPELFQLKCLSPALAARPHLNGNNPSIPRI